jgi:hypothetical protein
LSKAKTMDVSYISLGVIAVTLKWLLTYAARRYQLIETAHIDLTNRLNNILTEFYVINIWISKQNHKKYNDPPVGKERFTFFENAEKDLAYVLWPKEEKALRYAYRYIEVAESVRDQFIDLVDEKNIESSKKRDYGESFYQSRIENTVESFNYCVARILHLNDAGPLVSSLEKVKEKSNKYPKKWKSVQYNMFLKYPFSQNIFMKKAPIYGTIVFMPVIFALIILGYFFFPDFHLYEWIEYFLSVQDDDTFPKERAVLTLFILATIINLLFFYIVCILSLNFCFRQNRNQSIIFKWADSQETEKITSFKPVPDSTRV